ncbi:MAG: retroviral-like aspartic protease family protein [Lachnospiraceae bacterium]|nr:retroviral-like aspartic protease family protein [Lachnospiraceae bacterium]MDE7204406.1 retroviral-like aspartic protease family protein [Lachnospiraceae bacterium]
MLYTVSDEGIFTANCEMYILDKRSAVMQFIIDTGASITCCRAKELGVNLIEEDFITSRSNTRYLNGVLKEGDGKKNTDRFSIKFYEVQLKRFKIGTSIILENVSVWVTFDKRFYTCLLGQDILEQLYYLHLGNSKELLISDNTDDLKKYMGSMKY